MDARALSRLVLALLLPALLPGCAPPPPTPHAPPAGYERPYGPSPFAPAESRIEGPEFLEPDALAGSAACGRCHPEIYGQWQDSLHRSAATDVFARFAIDGMGQDYGIASTRLCVGCHDPGRLLSGGVDRSAPPVGPTYREGVSCLSCHLVTGTHGSPQTRAVANASFTVEPLDRALLFPAPGAGAEELRRHGKALRRPELSRNDFCDACHRFFIPVEMGGTPPGRLRLQSAEAAGTPYGDPSDPAFRSCVDCHMPKMAGVDPAAKGGLIHDHRSLGSNLLIPTLEGNRPQVDATLAFRRAGAVSLEVRDLARGRDGGLELPVVLHNRLNGHDFPSGATDISESWLELFVTDAAGRVVYRSPGLDANRFLSPEAPSLNTLVMLPSGDLDFLHDLFSQVELRRHPRVRPGGSLELRVPVRLPDGAAGPLQARVVLRSRHGNERWNRWTFNWADVEVPVADLAEAGRTLGPVPPPLPAPPAPPPAPVPPEGMVYVPGGVYEVGNDPSDDPEAESDEFPRHGVALAPFFLDRVPVTMARYADAVRRGVVKAPPPLEEPPYGDYSWQGDRPPAGLEDHPVVLVLPEEADAFCRAEGKRLPLAVEWEAAARGPGRRRFAWGDRFDPALCNTAESGRGRTVPAGSAPGNASPFGALDMGCNVSEWLYNDFKAYPRVRHLDNREDWAEMFNGGLRELRGASCDHSWRRARPAARSQEGADVRKLIGFRCVKPLAGGTP